MDESIPIVDVKVRTLYYLLLKAPINDDYEAMELIENLQWKARKHQGINKYNWDEDVIKMLVYRLKK